jgi:hypothetical protein
LFKSLDFCGGQVFLLALGVGVEEQKSSMKIIENKAYSNGVESQGPSAAN